MKEENEKIIQEAKKKYGNITIANSDSAWDAYAHSAIEEAIRAVNELS